MDTFLGLLGIFGSFVIILIVIFIAILVVYTIGLWKLFKKAGRQGWEAIIPFYNNWVYVEIAGLNWWYFLLIIANTIINICELDFLSSIASISYYIALFFCNYNIAKRLHKDTIFAAIMTVAPFIMIPLIGFSKEYVFDSSIAVNPNGPIDSDGKLSNNTDSFEGSKRFCTSCGSEISVNSNYCSKCGKEIK